MNKPTCDIKKKKKRKWTIL